MSINGSNQVTVGDPGRWRAPKRCPDPVSTRPVVPEEQTRESEAAILVQAYSDGNATLDAVHAELRPACAVMEQAYWVADNQIEDYQRFAAVKSAADAGHRVTGVIARHADDGPEDRRRQPWWASGPVVWTAIFISALFDTVFLGDVLAQMLDLGGPAAVFMYLPGFGIAICLIVSGTLLASAYSRHRYPAERKPERGTGRFRRVRGDLPWPMWTFALLFSGFSLLVLAVWARNRAFLSSLPRDEWADVLPTFEYHIAALLILLTVAAIALKVISQNPYAASAKKAEAVLEQARSAAGGLRGQAVALVAEHASAWARLQGLLAGARAQAERFVEAGRARILELRSERATPGKPLPDLMTPLTVGLWPSDGSGPATVYLADELKLHFEVLDYAADLAGRHTPKMLEERLVKVDEDLRAQFTVSGVGGFGYPDAHGQSGLGG